VSALLLIVRELIGLFIDDGSLAIAIVVVVILAAISAALDAPALVTGGTLFLGCLAAVFENIARTARKS
jgi:hypothetical protein